MNESDNRTNEQAEASSPAALFVEVFGRTDVGLVREHNEDNFLVADLTEGNRSIRPEVRKHRIGPQGSIFVVCDGMGGAAAGEVASQIAVDTIYDMMQQGAPATSEEALAQKLEKAICEAGRRILTSAKINRSQRGMGTTVTAAALFGPRLIIGQVGDSRAYILRNRRLIQVTKDQSLVQQLIDAKQMTEEEAKTFDKNNIILQALGTAEEVHVDVTSVVLKQGDRLVMCSDGLSGLVDNDAIRDIVYETADPMNACRVLTEKACEGGGHDNITAIVAAFSGDSLALPPEGGADPELAYSRFTFSRMSETTARKLRPGRPSERQKNDTETTQPVTAVPKRLPLAPQSVVRNAQRRPPSYLVGGGILLVSAVIIAAVIAGGGHDASEESPTAVPTAQVPPPLRPQMPKTQMPVSSPASMVPVTPIEAAADTAPITAPDTAPTADAPEPTSGPAPEPKAKPEEAKEPPLAPTPEDAITKPKDKSSLYTSPKREHHSKSKKQSNETPEKSSKDTDTKAEEAPASPNEEMPAADKQQSDPEAVDAKSDDETPAEKPAEQNKPEEKKPAEQDNGPASPGKIDDNPFAEQ